MSKEDIELFTDINFLVDTVNTDTLVREIYVTSDDPYFGNASFTIYTELLQSYGDTTILYDGQFFILNGVSYINFDTTTWVNYRGVTIYR